MKLLGFEGHEITSMSCDVISDQELQDILKNEQSLKKEENVLIQEEVNVKLTKNLNKTLIIGDVVIIDIEGYRRITLTIVGEFIFDKENEEDSQVVSDSVFEDFWPMLRKYIPPAVSTLTSITNRGELEITL